MQQGGQESPSVVRTIVPPGTALPSMRQLPARLQALLLTSSDDSEDFDSGSRSPITSGDYSESAPGAASRSCVTTEGGASLGQGEDSEADYHSCVDPRQTGSFITACSRAPRTAATTISFGGAVGGPLDPAAGPASAGQSGGGASEGSVERGHAVLLLQPHTAGLEPLSEEGQQQQQGSASDGQDSGVEGAAEEEDANPEPAATAAGLGDSSSNTNQLSAQASALTAPLGTSSSFAAQMQARLLQQAAQAGLQPKTDRVASAAHTHHHPPVSAAQAQALHPEHEVQQPFGYQAAAQLPALTSVSMPLATAAGPGVRGTQERGPHDAAKSASCSYSDDFELEAAAEAALGSSAGTEGRAAIPVGGSGTGAAGPSSSYNRASGSQQLPPACESSLSSIGSPPAESHILSGHRSYTSSLPPSSTASTYQYPHPDVALARSRSASRAGSNVGSEASCSRRPSGSSSAGGAAGGTATPGTAAGSDAGPAKVSRGSSASGSQAGSHRGSAAGSLAAGNEASSGWASTYSCELFDEGSRSLPGDDDDNEAAEQLEKGGGEQLPGQEEAGPDAGPAQTSASDAATSGESKDLGAGSHEEGHDEEGDEDEEEPPVPASETEAHEVTEEEDFDSHPGSAGVSRSSSMFVRSSGVPNIPGLGFAPGPSILQRALAQAAAGGHSGLPPLPHQVAHHKAAAAAAPGQASSSSIKASSAQSAGASADISAHSVGVSADNSTPSMQSTGAELETGAGVGGVGSRGSSRGGSSRGGSSDGASSIGGASVASAPSASHSSSSSTVSVGSKRSSSSVTRSSGGGSSETGSRNWRAGPRTGGAGSLSSVHSLGSSEEGSSSQGGAGRSKQRVFTNPIALEHDVYAEAPHATARVATPPTVVAAGGLPGGFVFGPKEVEALSLSISFGLAQEPAVVVRVPTIAPAGAKSTGGAQTAGGAHGSAEGPSSSLSEALSGPPSTAPSVGGGSALMDAAQGQEPAQAVLGTSAAAAAEAAPAPTAATGAGPSALDRVLGPPMGPGPVALPPRSSSAGGAYSSGHRRSSSSCPSFASSGGAPPGASGPGSHRSTPPGTPSKQQLQQQLDARRRSTAQRGGSCGGSVLSSSGDTIFSKLEAELDEIERMYIGATVEVEVPAATGQVGEAGAGGSSSKEVMSLPPTNPVPGRSPSRRTSTDAAVAAAAAIAHATLASPRGDIALALSRHTAAGNAVRSQETSPVSAAAAAAAVLNGEGVTGPPSSGAVTGVVEEGQEEAAPTSPLRLLQQQRQRHASPARPVPDSPSSLVELVARIALGEGEGGDEAVSAATALGSGPGSHATPSRTSSSAAAAAAAAMAGGAEAVANVVRPTRTPGTSSKTGQAMTLTELLAQHLAEEAAEEEQQQAAEASLGGAPPAASQPPAVARSLEDSLSMAAAAPLEQGSVLGQGPADTLAAAPDAGVQPGPDGREVLLQQLDLAQAQLQRMLERAAHRRASPEPSPHAAESAAAALLASAQATESQHEAAAAGVGADAQPKAQPRPQRKSEPLVLTRLDAAALHASQSFGVPMPQVPMADEEMSEASLGLYAVNSSASVVNRATTESLQSLPRLSPRDAAVQQQPPEPATVLRPLNALDFGGALLSPKTAVPASGVSSHSRGSSGGSLRSHHSTAAAAQTQPLHTQPSAPAAAPASAPAQHPAPTQAAQAPVAPVQASAEGNKGLQVSQSPAAATAGIVPGTEAVAPERSPSPVATAGAVAHVLLAPQLPMRETQEGEEGYGEGVVTIPAELTESMDRAAAAVDASMEQASSLLKSVLDLMSQPGAATNIPEAQLSAAASALALLQARQAAQASGPVTPSQRTLQAVPLAPAPAQAPAAPEPAAPAAPPAPTINTPAKAQEVARSSRASVHAPATSAAPAVPTTRAPAAPPAAAAPARATAPASQAASVAAALGLPSEGLQAALAALASLPSPHIHPSAWQRIMGPEVHAEAQAAAAQPSATATAHPQAPQTIPVATVSAGAAGEGIGMPAFSAPSPAGGRRYVMPGSAGASTGAASSMPSVPWTPQPQHRGQQPQQPPWAAVSAAPATTGKPSRSTRSILAQLASPKPISSRYRSLPFQAASPTPAHAVPVASAPAAAPLVAPLNVSQLFPTHSTQQVPPTPSGHTNISRSRPASPAPRVTSTQLPVAAPAGAFTAVPVMTAQGIPAAVSVAAGAAAQGAQGAQYVLVPTGLPAVPSVAPSAAVSVAGGALSISAEPSGATWYRDLLPELPTDLLQRLHWQQVNTQAKQQAAEAEAAMAALLAPGSGLEGRLSQAVSETEAGELAALHQLVKLRQVLTPLERVRLWGRVEKLLAANLPPPPSPPAGSAGSMGAGGGLSPGRRMRSPPRRRLSMGEQGFAGVGAGVAATWGAPGGPAQMHNHAPSSVGASSAGSIPGAWAAAAATVGISSAGANISHPGAATPRQRRYGGSAVAQAAAALGLAVPTAAPTQQDPVYGCATQARPPSPMRTTTTLTQLQQYPTHLQQQQGQWAAGMYAAHGHLPAYPSSPAASPRASTSPGLPLPQQPQATGEEEECRLENTMSRVHRAVAPNATLALLMDLEWQRLRENQAARASGQ